RDLEAVGYGVQHGRPVEVDGFPRVKSRITSGRPERWRARRAEAGARDEDAARRGPHALLERAVHRLNAPEVRADGETADGGLRRRGVRRTHQRDWVEARR